MKAQISNIIAILALSSAILNAQNTATHEPSLWDMILGGGQETQQQTYTQPQSQKQESWWEQLFGGQPQSTPQPQTQPQQQTSRHWWQDLGGLFGGGQQTQQDTYTQPQSQPQHQSWWERLLGRQQQPEQQPQPQAQKPLEEQLFGAFKDPKFLDTLNRIKANPAGISQWINAPVNGATPLISAIQQNSLPLATLLLLTGAELNTTDAQGRTPLQIAQAQGNQELVTLLNLAQSPMGRMASNFLRKIVSKSLMQEASQQQTHDKQYLGYPHKSTTTPAFGSEYLNTQTPFSM